jgi:hypothetical protein
MFFTSCFWLWRRNQHLELSSVSLRRDPAFWCGCRKQASGTLPDVFTCAGYHWSLQLVSSRNAKTSRTQVLLSIWHEKGRKQWFASEKCWLIRADEPVASAALGTTARSGITRALYHRFSKLCGRDESVRRNVEWRIVRLNECKIVRQAMLANEIYTRCKPSNM